MHWYHFLINFYIIIALNQRNKFILSKPSFSWFIFLYHHYIYSWQWIFQVLVPKPYINDIWISSFIWSTCLLSLMRSSITFRYNTFYYTVGLCMLKIFLNSTFLFVEFCIYWWFWKCFQYVKHPTVQQKMSHQNAIEDHIRNSVLKRYLTYETHYQPKITLIQVLYKI